MIQTHVPRNRFLSRLIFVRFKRIWKFRWRMNSPFRRKRLQAHFWRPSGWAAREQRIAREQRKERKNPAAKRRSGLPRKVRKWTRTQTYGQYGHKKVLKHFRFRTSVKTATTYSPTCAVPSAWRSLTSLFGMGKRWNLRAIVTWIPLYIHDSQASNFSTSFMLNVYIILSMNFPSAPRG